MGTRGTFKMNGLCSAGTVILTFATSPAAPTGWACNTSDQTTPADSLKQTASSVSSATLTGTAANADVISFSCSPF